MCSPGLSYITPVPHMAYDDLNSSSSFQEIIFVIKTTFFDEKSPKRTHKLHFFNIVMPVTCSLGLKYTMWVPHVARN